jgi:hypothetical protein
MYQHSSNVHRSTAKDSTHNSLSSRVIYNTGAKITFMPSILEAADNHAAAKGKITTRRKTIMEMFFLNHMRLLFSGDKVETKPTRGRALEHQKYMPSLSPKNHQCAPTIAPELPPLHERGKMPLRCGRRPMDEAHVHQAYLGLKKRVQTEH